MPPDGPARHEHHGPVLWPLGSGRSGRPLHQMDIIAPPSHANGCVGGHKASGSWCGLIPGPFRIRCTGHRSVFKRLAAPCGTEDKQKGAGWAGSFSQCSPLIDPHTMTAAFAAHHHDRVAHATWPALVFLFAALIMTGPLHLERQHRPRGMRRACGRLPRGWPSCHPPAHATTQRPRDPANPPTRRTALHVVR